MSINKGDKVIFRKDLEHGKKYGDVTFFDFMGRYLNEENNNIVHSCDGNKFKLSGDSFWFSEEMLDSFVKRLYTVKIPIVEWDEYSSETKEIFYTIWLCVNSGETRLYHEEYEKSEHGYKWVKEITMEDIENIDKRYVAFAEPV